MATWSVMADVPNPIIVDAAGTAGSGYVLKAYLPGTTTSTSIAIDSAGSSPQTSITANAEGKWEVTGNEILPFIDRKHKWGIFANATDAAANTPFYMGPFDNVDRVSTSGTTASVYSTVAAMKAESLTAGDTAETQGYTTAGDGGGGAYLIVPSQAADGYADHVLANGNVAVLQLENGVVNGQALGVIADTDVTLNIDALAAYCNTNQLVGILPTGTLNISSDLDWSALLNLEMEGQGWLNTVLTFTTDSNLSFGGRRFEGGKLLGLGATSTKTGFIATSTQRKFIQRLWVEKFNIGLDYQEGNLSKFDFITTLSNNSHGFLCSDTTGDSNAATIGMVDTRSNGGDGFHMTTGTSPNACQQMASAGQIVSQNNTGRAANISGRGHNLNIYDETNGSGVQLDASSEGCRVEILFGDHTDLGTNNDVILHRIGSVEAVQHQRLQALLFEIRNRSVSGSFEFRQETNRLLNIIGLNSSSDFTMLLSNDAGTNFNLSVEGRVVGQQITNTDLDVAPSVVGANSISLTNSAPTNITAFLGGTPGQELTVTFNDGNSTIVRSTSMRLAGGANMVGTSFDCLKLIYDGNDWLEISRSNNA